MAGNFKKHTLFFGTLLVIIGIISSCSFLAYYISPADFLIFQWIGLMLPILLVFHVCLFFVGLARRKWYAILALVALLSNSHYLMAKFRLNFSSSKQSSPTLKLATYNVQQLKMYYNLPSAELIADFIQDEHIDILCLQEVPITHTPSDLKRIFPKTPYCILTNNNKGNSHLAILSKHPLRYIETLSFIERSNTGLIADVMIGADTLRLFNCHLQTTGLNQVNNNNGKPFTLNAFNTISNNMIHRSRQAEKLRQKIKQSAYPAIVCGDFNAPIVSYSYHTIKGKLQDAFTEAGHGYSYSYRYFQKMFRIDHIFLDGGSLRTTLYQIGSINCSDHFPIIMGFEFIKAK